MSAGALVIALFIGIFGPLIALALAAAIISGVVQFGEKRVRDVMVPRTDIFALPQNLPPGEMALRVGQSKYSRVPLYRDSIDNIVGFVHVFDMLKNAGTEVPSVLPVAFTKPSTSCKELLSSMLRERRHLAIVRDDAGVTIGLLTLEDLLEELVGDIRDEYDVHEEAEYVRVNDNEFNVDASINIDDFNELLGIELSDDEADTLGGFIYSHFGRVPLIGETLEAQNLRLRVESVEGQRIRKVRVTRVKTAEPADTEGATDGETEEPEQVRD